MNITHVEKTLEFLRVAGAKGIHSFELNQLVGTNYSPRRILDLKKRGHLIATKREKRGHAWGVRYFLADSPQLSPTKEKVIFDNVRNVAICVS